MSSTLSMTRVARGVLCASALVLVLAASSSSSAAFAATVPELRLKTVAELTGTTAATTRAGDDTLYVTEQEGRVRALRKDRLVDAPVLDISDDVLDDGEQGLLGLAFSPDGTWLYVHYSDLDGDTRVDAFRMTGDVADPATRRNLLAVDQPQSNHNGGELATGPDGYLYLGLGDGGGQGDTGEGHASGGNGQSLRTLLGKILRIQPTPEAEQPYAIPADNPFVGDTRARPEIWAYGLRNPWRFSFDRKTGDLWIADVGQNEFEEIDFVAAVPGPAGAPGTNAGKGVNFGWNLREGVHEFRGDVPEGAVDPVFEFDHSEGACSVTGGFVVRGTKLRALRGTYLFTDYCKGDLYGLHAARDRNFTQVDLGLEASGVSSFGEGSKGEVYVLSQSDGILRVVKG